MREFKLSDAKDKSLGRTGKTTLPDNQLNTLVDYVGIISDIEQAEDRVPGKVWATDQGVIRFTEKGFDFVTNAEPDYSPKKDYIHDKIHIKPTDSTASYDEYVAGINEVYEGETDFGDGQVLPVFIKNGKYKKLTALQANKFGERLQGPDTDTKALQKEIDGYIKEGFVGIETLSDEGVMFMGKEIPQRILFNPSQIRSINAAFDPNKTENPKLLAKRKDSYSEMKGKDISYEVEVESTGETYTVTVDAARTMEDMDARIQALTELRKCI